jgi:GNAT superfamily N-acetyltransferase
MQKITILEKGIIRPGKPEDADTLAQHVFLAGKSNAKISVYELLFPGGKQATLEWIKRLILAETRSFFHYSHSLVYQVGDEVVASGCHYDEAKSGSTKLMEAFIEVGFSLEDITAARERAACFFRVVPIHPEGVWVVEHGATSEGYRGHKIIGQLMQSSLDYAKELGYKKVELGMFMGHDSALRAYKECGFIVADEKTDPEFEEIFGVPGMMCLAREL